MISTPRSACPINRSLEFLGDQWSLLILRDIALYDRRSFRDLLKGNEEGISSPMLASRLKDLVALDILSKSDAGRGRQGRYSLTERGLALIPLLFELAEVGHRLDPATQLVPTPFGADAAGIAASVEDLRGRHLAPASASTSAPISV